MELKVKKISGIYADPQLVPSLMDQAGIEYNNIDIINWDTHTYRPEVKFRIAYTDDAILLHYKVKEESVKAVTEADNGNVWTDSCVEFFSIPCPEDGIYYNFECNCAGTLLIGSGAERKGRIRGDKSVTDQILRWSTLGREPFAERIGETEWEIAIILPFKAYFRHEIKSMEGAVIRANFYKCGDDQKTPHYLSWSPIGTEKPAFHAPDYFGTLYFE
ncbi:MAG: hypothetical protein II318_00865 [Bacteroidales bacterium]|nr:hypothetical protein [Bacteroidales bacterium]